MTDQGNAAPRDGETLGALRFDERMYVWVYDAGYASPLDCGRRAETLSKAYGLSFFVTRQYVAAGDYFAATAARNTAALRSMMRSTLWFSDDAAAHVAETVDELRGETFQREQLVYASGDTERQMPGRITRLARDGSWADVDWGYWSKRMQTRYLRPAPSVPAFRISAANIADAIEREALAVDGLDEDEE